MPEKLNKCAHPGCRCSLPVQGDYCSDHCKTAEGESEKKNGCGCGHPECRSK